MSTTTQTTLGSWIAGQWARSGGELNIVDPSTGEVFDRLSVAGIEEVDAAVASAQAAFERYRGVSQTERAGWCLSAANAVERHADRLAEELSREHGKPVAEARAEIAFAVSGFRTAAGAVLGDPGASPAVADARKRVTVRRAPLGVWAVITPWNFPVNIPVEYLGPAISTGNAVVWKPAPTTARIAALLREVLLESSIPEDLIQLIITDDNEVAQHLVIHNGIRAVGFTGGSGTGKYFEQIASHKHLLLELGGNTAIVVLDDADLPRAAKAVAASAFWNAGQVCSAAGKVLVPRALAHDFAARVAEEAKLLVTGDPGDERTTLGPLHIDASRSRIQAQVDDAVSRGARVLLGGKSVDGPGWFYEPTVLVDVPMDARIFYEETFGPVAAIVSYDSEHEALGAANHGEYGLVAAVHTTSLDRAYRVGEAIDAGLVVVNDTSNYWEHAIAFGGAAGRSSGRGRLGGRFALEHFTQVKTLAVDVTSGE